MPLNSVSKFTNQNAEMDKIVVNTLFGSQLGIGDINKRAGKSPRNSARGSPRTSSRCGSAKRPASGRSKRTGKRSDESHYKSKYKLHHLLTSICPLEAKSHVSKRNTEELKDKIGEIKHGNTFANGRI